MSAKPTCPHCGSSDIRSKGNSWLCQNTEHSNQASGKPKLWKKIEVFMKSFDDTAYRNKPGYIYLIRAKERRRYKIGLTTRSGDQRFNELNGSQSPYPLELLKVLSTDNVTETERYLHDKFSSQRRHGEWFEFSDRQLKEVFREFERLENGNRAWFRFPALPSITLPNLPSLGSLVGTGLQLNANIKGLVIAGIGAAWLSINFAGCLQQLSLPDQKPQTQSSQGL